MTLTRARLDRPRHDVAQYVDVDEGLVARDLFTSPEIYAQELDQVFARSWLLLTHESELPRPGSFVTTTMGEDPVIVTRHRDGTIRAFLNSCRHRGMRVCRADFGVAKSFTCTYHGWTYDLAGDLVQVPSAGQYGDDLPRAEWGLVPVTQVQTFQGLVFGNFDPAAPALRECLGDIAWYLEAWLGRRAGGMEVCGPPMKWMLTGNWKFAAEQFAGDAYHAGSSHVSALRALMGDLPPEVLARLAEQTQDHAGGAVADPFGNGYYYALGSPGSSPSLVTLPSLLQDYYREILPEMVERLGAARTGGPAMGSNGTVFPNFSWLPFTSTMRVWHPRGPDQMEIHSWVVVDRDAPEAVKQAQREFTARTFSAGGIFEQDDGENWADIQTGLRGAVASRYPFNYRMARTAPGPRDHGPGRHVDGINEWALRNFYRRYTELMGSPTWPVPAGAPA